jgi:hypothetical protein
MAKTAVSEVNLNHEDIAAEAYQIYLREGAQPGREIDHWLKAETNLRARGNGNGASANGNGAANGNGNGHTELQTRSQSAAPSAVTTEAQGTTQTGRNGGTRRAAKR